MSGRATTITGTDAKLVVGLDCKKVDFACDIKGIDLTTKVTEAGKKDIDVWRDGLKAKSTGMEAEAVSALKLVI
jgi:hypothetical protein